LLCGDFLLSDPAPHLENRKTVCMGYPAKTSQERAGKRRRKGAGNPCRENGTPNINWSKWPVDVVNDTKRHSPETSSTLQLVQCVQIEHIDSIHVTLNLDLTFCQATVKSGKCCFSVLTKLP
jgi:hypothetical protein